MLRPFLIVPLFLVACGDNIGPQQVPETCGVGLEPYAGEPGDFNVATVWVQPDPEAAAIDVREGCELWRDKGLECEIIPSELAADVKVYVVHDPCRMDPQNGGYVLATAEPHGLITVYLECLRDWFEPDEDGGISREILRLVVGHEVGHEAGMWWHVPASCDENAAADDFEKDLMRRGICGPSLMNPILDPNVCFITDPDAKAYDLRTYGSFLTASESGTGCVLTYRPAP
jgi:hypothetical protein